MEPSLGLLLSYSRSLYSMFHLDREREREEKEKLRQSAVSAIWPRADWGTVLVLCTGHFVSLAFVVLAS